jgi:hypothetical protein
MRCDIEPYRLPGGRGLRSKVCIYLLGPIPPSIHVYFREPYNLDRSTGDVEMYALPVKHLICGSDVEGNQTGNSSDGGKQALLPEFNRLRFSGDRDLQIYRRAESEILLRQFETLCNIR